MSDVALAHGLVVEIAGHCWRGKGDMLDRVHEAVRRFNPATEISRRRVRAFYHREAALVKFHEMTELAEVAHLERARLHQVQEAKRDHAEYIARTARLATALAVQDEEFHRAAIEGFRRIASRGHDPRIDGAADSGAEAAAGSNNQSRAVGAGDSR